MQITVHNREVSIASVVRSKTGGLITFKKYAELKGVNLSDKAAKKTANQEYSVAKRDLFQQNRKMALLAVADRDFQTTKVNVKTDDLGLPTGFDIAVRTPSKKDIKAEAPAAVNAALAAKDKEMQDLLAKLAAMGITVEDLDKVPALA
jgi:hypothetical protein